MSEKNNEDLSLQTLIKKGDDLIDGIINKKTVKSHYVREEDEGKLVALQFPVQERKYEKLKQNACTLGVDEHVEILRIFFTLEHFLNLDFVTGSFMLYIKEFQEAYGHLRAQIAQLIGIYESLVALKQNETESTATLQQLFIKKLLQVGRYAFQGAFNMGRAKI